MARAIAARAACTAPRHASLRRCWCHACCRDALSVQARSSKRPLPLRPDISAMLHPERRRQAAARLVSAAAERRAAVLQRKERRRSRALVAWVLGSLAFVAVATVLRVLWTSYHLLCFASDDC